jgi:hypothetical protein
LDDLKIPLFGEGAYNNNKAKKDPIKAVNPNTRIPASEVLPDGPPYAVSIQGYDNSITI